MDYSAFYGIIVEDVKFDEEDQDYTLPDGRKLSCEDDSPIPESVNLKPSRGFKQANLDTVCFDSIEIRGVGVCPEIVVGYYLGSYDNTGTYAQFARLEEKAVLAAPKKRKDLIEILRELKLPFKESDIGFYIGGQLDF